jgi:hypothetical protein
MAGDLPLPVLSPRSKGVVMNEERIQEILDSNIDWPNQAAAIQDEEGIEALYRLVMELEPDKAARSCSCSSSATRRTGAGCAAG